MAVIDWQEVLQNGGRGKDYAQVSVRPPYEMRPVLSGRGEGLDSPQEFKSV